MKKNITIIVAAAANHAIGKDNQLLWHLAEDLKRFKRLTSGHAIIMGRKHLNPFPKHCPIGQILLSVAIPVTEQRELSYVKI